MKRLLYIVFITILFVMPTTVSAEDNYYYVWDDPDSDAPVSIRESNTSSSTLLGRVYEGGIIKVISTVDGSTNDGCKNHKWFKMEYGNIKGYSCSYWYEKKEITNDNIDESYDFEKEIAKFPLSYQKNLIELHKMHPAWKFIANDINYKFNGAVNELNESNISLIQVTKTTNGYGYLWQNPSVFDYKTNTYFSYDGVYGKSTYGWFIPNDQTIAFYLDPRNYLNEEKLFAFLNEKFDECETIDAIASVTKGTFMSGSYIFNTNDVLNEETGVTEKENEMKTYNETFYEAGKQYGISSVMLAARARQEISAPDKDGDGLLDASDSASGILIEGTPYYNFFNIGAGSGANSIDNALDYAKNNGWSTPYLAIQGGAKFLSKSYITQNQHTLYFQKYNVINLDWTHQYQQNIQAPMTEATTTYKSYLSNGLTDAALTFFIPIYQDMPDTTSLPSPESPNNYLLNISIDGNMIEGFDGTKNKYDYQIEYNTKSINIATTKALSTSAIKGDGIIDLSSKDKNYEVKINVTAPNKDVRTYTINIIRKDNPDDIVYPEIDEIMTDTGIKYNNVEENTYYLSGINLNVTQDRIKEIFNNRSKNIEVTYKKNSNNKSNFVATNDAVTIVSGNNTYTLTIIIRGDTNGDGMIDLIDLLQVRKKLLESIDMDDNRLRAADVNKDGKVDLIDLLKIRKHLLGTLIEQ